MKKDRKIGIFDSGFGGLTILKSIRNLMPEYDYVYLGDTARAPYGSRSDEQIYQFTCEAIDFLFSKNCDLVILACNTASAQCLRKIQQEYLPKKHKNKNVLGVVVPTLEAIASDKKSRNILVIATEATVRSGSYPEELCKINRDISVLQQACPLLVPMIEAAEHNKPFSDKIIKEYLSVTKDHKIDHLVLGCTHYGIIEGKIRTVIGADIKITNQEKIVPLRLKKYLEAHPEYKDSLSAKGSLIIYTTDISERFEKFTNEIIGLAGTVEKINF